jgi:NDP-sugar pyrophosphorylase family protein
MNIQELIDNFRNKYYLPNLIEKLGTTNVSRNELIKIVRPITKNEIAKLELNGNMCADWSKVYVEPDFNGKHIIDNKFSGRVYLGNYSGEVVEVLPGLKIENGIYNSNISNSYLDSECLVINNRLISQYYISSGAIVMNNDLIHADEGTNFGNGTVISVGSEVGGRDITLYAEQDVNKLSNLITGKKNREIYNKYNEMIDSYADNSKSFLGIICRYARVINNRKIVNSFIGEGAEIDNTTLIKNSTIISSLDEVTEILDGVILDRALCQWGVEVASGAIVTRTLLSEHSGVERHAKVTDSMIGPNTTIGEGEVTASIIGPYIGFHHQSMVIGALWFNGRGNVGYGANIGSNHTSKLPDQEHFCGEGMFYGLGCNIKYPANYENAPYSIVATGVTTLPQKVSFPFSLIADPFSHYEDISPAYNEIMPAWVLSDNSYSVFRNEDKFIKRNKAKRSVYDFRVFREDIVEKMLVASENLKSIKGKDIYTDKDLSDLGKNVLTEKNRLKAIDAYDFFIKYYLFKELVEERRNGFIDKLIEIYSITNEQVNNCLEEYKSIFAKIIDMVITSKSKDYIRGDKIIDDYAEWHADLEDDKIINTLNEIYNSL